MKKGTFSSSSGIILHVILFTFVYSLIVLVASFISLFNFGPNIAWIANILIPFLIATPLAYFLFIYLFTNKRTIKSRTYILSLVLFPVIFGSVFALTLIERNPKHLFRVFVANPIPAGISEIKASDITYGFDTDIVLAFKGTPESLEEIITKNQLLSDHGSLNYDNNPHEYFPELDWNNDWLMYEKCEEKDEITEWCIWMWVAPDHSAVLYRFVDF